MDVKWESVGRWTPPPHARKIPTWRAFALRMFTAFAFSVAIFVVAMHPALRAYPAIQALSALPFALLWLSFYLMVFRYKMRRQHDLVHLPPHYFRVEKEAAEEADLDLRVLSSTRFAAEGTLASGQPFFLRALLHLPWYPWSRYSVVVFVETPDGSVAAHIDSKSSTVHPAERAPAIEASLTDLQAVLREHGASEIFIGPKFVQVSIVRNINSSTIKELLDFALRMQAQLETYRPGGYRGGPLARASVDEVQEIEALTTKAWRQLPLPS